MTARTFSLLTSAVCLLLAAWPSSEAWAKKKARAPRDTRPGWMQDNDCLRKDEGGAGEEEELEPPQQQTLHFDEARPPEHATLLAQPDVLLFKVAAINEGTEPVAAWVEVSICGFQETCVTSGGDYRLFGKRGRIEPGESRFVVFETGEKIDFGVHRITFALFDESGTVRDWWVSEPVQVGYSDVRVDELVFPGHQEPRKARAKLVEDAPVTFSVVASNFGEAPEGVVAIFAIDGGGEFTCGVELYTDPVRIDPNQQGVVLSKEWKAPTKGRHILSVILKDLRGKVIYENYGISFELY